MGMTTRSVCLLSVAILATSLAGCGKPTAAEVFEDNRDAAAQTQQRIEAHLQPLDEVGEMVGASVLDSCVTGHRNWVSDEGFDVRCEVIIGRAYVLPAGDFRDAADAVNRAATSSDCAVDDTEAEKTLTNEWDKLKGTEDPYEGPYRPDDIPSYPLGCSTDDTRSASDTLSTTPHLEARAWATVPVEEGTLPLLEWKGLEECTSTPDGPCRWSGDTAEDVLKSQPEDGWLVFVWARADYALTGAD